MASTAQPDQAVRLKPGPVPFGMCSAQVLVTVTGACGMWMAFLGTVARPWIPEVLPSLCFSFQCPEWGRPCQRTCAAIGWTLNRSVVCRPALLACLTMAALRWASYQPCAPLQALASCPQLCVWQCYPSCRTEPWDHESRLGGNPSPLSVRTMPDPHCRILRHWLDQYHEPMHLCLPTTLPEGCVMTGRQGGNKMPIFAGCLDSLD